MYRLLIVDDEEIEREGMVEFIPWEKYDVEVIGTAWNGIDGLKQIQEKEPDIVLVDIMMPVMNGIELIKKTRETFPEIEFIVLSGYGEYEYTSQAMEEGVRHYVLKPCDEEKIVVVLKKVKDEIRIKRNKKQLEEKYQYTVRKLVPHAKSQIFQNMLLGNEQMKTDYQLFMDEIGNVRPQVVVLAFRIDGDFDYLEKFVIQNIVSELLGEQNILLFTVLQKVIYFLINAKQTAEIEKVVDKTREEFVKFRQESFCCVLSKAGEWEQISLLYMQVQELFQIANEKMENELLHFELLNDVQKEAMAILDYSTLKQMKRFDDVLFEIYLLFLKMELKQYDYYHKEEICSCFLQSFYGQELPRIQNKEDREWELLETMVQIIADQQCQKSEDESRVRQILLVIYKNIKKQKTSIHYLCKKELFMNEDYFGRLFLKIKKLKFSSYLLQQRIELAKRLLQYDPNIKTAKLIALTGFSADGQYFSKVFRKVTGYKPTEYRDMTNRTKELS